MTRVLRPSVRLFAARFRPARRLRRAPPRAVSCNETYPNRVGFDMTDPSCPACAQPVMRGARFCVSCGTPLTKLQPDPDTAAPRTCIYCGREFPTGDRFCGGCGSDNGPGIAPILSDLPLQPLMAALQAAVAPQGTLVLVERPGLKRPKRCELFVSDAARVPAEGSNSFLMLLEDAHVWDGLLFAGRAGLTPNSSGMLSTVVCSLSQPNMVRPCFCT